MLKSCCGLIVLLVGEVCPLCGKTADNTNPPAPTPKAGRMVVFRSKGYKLRKGFRCQPEYDGEAAGIAEQNVRKMRKEHGTHRTMPCEKRQAVAGPIGRKQRQGLVRVSKAA